MEDYADDRFRHRVSFAGPAIFVYFASIPYSGDLRLQRSISSSIKILIDFSLGKQIYVIEDFNQFLGKKTIVIFKVNDILLLVKL